VVPDEWFLMSATAAELVDHAVATGLVPGAVLAAGVRTAEPVLLHVAGHAQRDAAATRPMTADTVFDLASLTKVVATLPVVLRLAGRGEIGLDQPVHRYLPQFAAPGRTGAPGRTAGPGGPGRAGKDTVTVRQLLLHTSGLPGVRRYYQHLNERDEILAAALAEPLAAPPGSVFSYSDVGFISLGELAVAVTGRGLDELVRDVVCGPLGMTATRYLPPPGWAGRIAATEVVGGAAKVGVVHDENAEILGGVAGHAGLFGTAGDLARYAAVWAGGAEDGALQLEEGEGRGRGPLWGMRAEALRCQTEGLDARRGLGWGLRGDRYDNMGDGWPDSGAGHTGFTGTSLSVDPRSGLWAVLLTNAVHFGRGPEHSVVGLRKQVHAAVAAELLG
jgi:CubicO group peptidase (beta-lactamase class C family)